MVFMTALLGALIVTAFPAVAQMFAPDTWRKAVPWVIGGFAGVLVLNWWVVYTFTPGMTGPLGGYHYLWLPLTISVAVSATAWMMADSNGDDSDHFKMATLGTSVAIGLLILVFMLVQIGNNWGNGNAKAKANYLQIEMAVDNPATDSVNEAQMPEVDTAHMVIVDKEVARFKGGQVISKNANWGSTYQAGNYVLQSVQQHMYWLAPLVYNNIFANWQFPNTPGFVVVDAEDPNADARMVQTPLACVPGAWLSQDVTRRAYISGYQNYRLVDTTFEVDDEWQPYFTIDQSGYIRGFTGTEVQGVLVMNAATCEIVSYGLEAVPAWVDRVIPGDAFQEYVDWYGNWHDAPWINFSGANKQMTADDLPAVAYNRADESPVWQFVMTSASTTDHSSTGVMLGDTRRNHATLYPISGIAVGSDVRHAFETNPTNIKNYPVTQIVLSNIYGSPTWVGIYTSPSGSGSGSTWQAIGLLNASTVQGADVIMASSKEEALRLYQQWLSNRGSNAVDPTSVSNLTVVEGVVDRFSADVQNGTTYYFVTLKDMNGNLVDRIFYGTSLVNDKLSLTQPGDHVVIKYQDTNQRLVAIADFNNLTLQIPLINPESGLPVEMPTLTPTPTLVPTPTPTSLFEPTPPAP